MIKNLEQSFNKGIGQSTIVAMKKDYVNDDSICLTTVVFVPSTITNKIIKDIINKLKDIEPWHYFYPAESMHITIKNVRTVSNPPLFSKTDIQKVDELLHRNAPNLPVFDFYVEDLIFLPTSLSLAAYSDDRLQKIVLSLDDQLRQIDVADNKQYISNSIFWGNITICRFTKNPGPKFMQEIQRCKKLKVGEFSVKTLNLITCNAVCHPASKNIIGEYNLG